MSPVSSETVIAVEWALLGVCFALVLARLYLRLHIQLKKPLPSDYCICLAWLCGIWGAVLDIQLKKLGWLDPATTWFDFESKTPDTELTMKIAFMSWFPLFTTQYLNKAAILLFLYHIFPSALGIFLPSLWTVTIFSIVSYIISILLVLLICLPKSPSGNHGLCSAQKSLVIWIFTWVLHFSSDICVFCLPFLILRILRLDWKKKVALYITFGFGIFSIGACLGRFVVVLITYPKVPTTTLELWCALDIATGLIVACLPPLRPYLTLRTEASLPAPPNARQQMLNSSHSLSALENSPCVLSRAYSQEQNERVRS